MAHDEGPPTPIVTPHADQPKFDAVCFEQKALGIDGAQLARMVLIIEQNETADPVDANPVRTIAVVLRTNSLRNDLKELRLGVPALPPIPTLIIDAYRAQCSSRDKHLCANQSRYPATRRVFFATARRLHNVRRHSEVIVLLASQQFELYPEWSRAIESDGARAAFHQLVGIAASSRRFMCHAQWKGEVRDFRFIEVASNEQPHSFITNQQWLLFYFRPPAVRSGHYPRDAVSTHFATFHETPSGEWTIKLAALNDVQKLVGIVNFQ